MSEEVEKSPFKRVKQSSDELWNEFGTDRFSETSPPPPDWGDVY